jgi:hypothetical protein
MSCDNDLVLLFEEPYPTYHIMAFPHSPCVTWLKAVSAATTCASAQSHELAPNSETVLLSSVDKLIGSVPLIPDNCTDSVSSRSSVKRSRSNQPIEDHIGDVKRFLIEPHRSTDFTAWECVKLQSRSIVEQSNREELIIGEARRYRLQTLRHLLM